jgi:hypothetical protein
MSGDLTVAECAWLTGLSVADVTRKCNSGTFPQAHHDTAGRWRIPVPDLVRAGYDCEGMDTLVDVAPVNAEPVALLSRATDVLAAVVTLWQQTHAAVLDTPHDSTLPPDAVDRITRLLTDATRNWNLAAQLYADAT